MKITLPLPAKALSPNARVHWATKAAATKKARQDAWLATKAIMNATGEPGGWNSATAQLTFYRPRNGRVDPDNLLASTKATWDGLVDAGLLIDDNQITHLPVRIMVDKDDPRLELEVRSNQ